MGDRTEFRVDLIFMIITINAIIANLDYTQKIIVRTGTGQEADKKGGNGRVAGASCSGGYTTLG
jgi:hypothetical protein